MLCWGEGWGDGLSKGKGESLDSRRIHWEGVDTVAVLYSSIHQILATFHSIDHVCRIQVSKLSPFLLSTAFFLPLD